MGVTYRWSATPLTEQRTDQMIVIISLGIVLALAVGGFVMAANIYGDQDQSPTDDVQHVVRDFFDPTETAQQQTLREPDFVMESERSCLGPYDTVRGWIRWDGNNIPSELPLCITNTTIADWYYLVLSYGGYEPYGGYIEVWQKDEFRGRIYIEWEDAGKGNYVCCTYNWWNASFYVKDNFCLDSNQYPMGYYDGKYIPGKEVEFKLLTDWTGCGQPDQDFTIIHSHSYQALSKRFILTLETKPPDPHRKFTLPIQCQIKTARVYNFFDPNNIQRRVMIGQHK